MVVLRRPRRRRLTPSMTVTVVTDSAATLPPELAASLGIVVVPLRITVGGGSFPDGTVDAETLLARTEEVTTAGPTPADFLEAIESRAGAAGVVVATVSHDIAAGTFLAARAAAAATAVPVRVVDTATAAGAEGLVVLAAARVAAAGGTLDEVEATARRVAARVRLVATLPDLDHLVRSGHVPEAAAWAARWMGLRPVVALRAGRITPLAPARGAHAARRRILAAWRRTRPARPVPLHVAALHSLAPAGAEELLAAVRAEVEPASAWVGPFGTVMLVHTGPGVVGLAWWWEDRPQA